MIRIRRAADRGHADHGWLDTRHSFSFADYYDPEHTGYRSLRVINDDRVAPGAGFPTHPHRDMEIITYVVDGALEHRDSMGNGSLIRPGDIQRMTAGTGVRHSEFNPSDSEGGRFLQIWMLPERIGLTPGYEQKHFPETERRGQLRLVASPDGRKDSITVQLDAEIYAGVLDEGDRVTHDLAPGRGSWIQVVRGRVRVGEHDLAEGDGAAFDDEPSVSIESAEHAELLLFDLA